MIEESKMETLKKKMTSKLNILLTGGINLGSFSNSKNLALDSFTNLKNVLKLARAKKIDFIIFTGNTFSQKYPQKVIYEETKEILRGGTGRVKEDTLKKVGEFEYLLPDQKSGYFQGDTQFRIPIFCIRGPNEISFAYGVEDFGKIDGIDILKKKDLITKTEEIPSNFEESEEILIIKPVIFVKNKTCIMIYFLDYMIDTLLLKKIKENKIEFQKPAEKAESEFIKVFKFLIIRQNPLFDLKFKETFENDKISPNIFPEQFFDLIIWGNKNFKTTEIIEVEGQKIFKISDLSRNDTISLYNQKYRYLGLLTIQKDKLKTKSCLMDCVRPIIRRKVLLKNDFQGALLKIERDLMLKISSHFKQKDGEDYQDLIKKPILALKILNYCDPLKIKFWEKSFKSQIHDLIANPK